MSRAAPASVQTNDTGNDAKIFERNVERLGLDLTRVVTEGVHHGYYSQANRRAVRPFYPDL